jgi:hypothetical protein
LNRKGNMGSWFWFKEEDEMPWLFLWGWKMEWLVPVMFFSCMILGPNPWGPRS